MKIHPLHILPAALLTAVLLSSCNETACPLNNTVMGHFGFYKNQEGGLSKIKVMETLTVTAAGTDSVLINQEYGTDEIKIPLSYTSGTDTIVFSFEKDNSMVTKDTIFITKRSYPYYESPDCPTVIFHNIEHLQSSHRYIDTVLLVNPNLDYNATENFKIVFHTTDY